MLDNNFRENFTKSIQRYKYTKKYSKRMQRSILVTSPRFPTEKRKIYSERALNSIPTDSEINDDYDDMGDINNNYFSG